MERRTGQENRNTAVRLAFLAAALLVVAALSLLLGSTRLSPVQVVRAALAGDWGNTERRMGREVRRPRTRGGPPRPPPGGCCGGGRPLTRPAWALPGGIWC